MNISYTINYCSKLLKNKLNSALEQEDLTASQFSVIKDIELNSFPITNNTGVRAVDVAERLNMDKPTVSGIVNRLVDKNYVKKDLNPEDQRSFLLGLTNESKAKIEKLEEINKKVIYDATKSVTEIEMEQFKMVLSKIIENLR